MTASDRLAEIRARLHDYSHEGKIRLAFTARDDLLYLLYLVDELQRERDALARRLAEREAAAKGE